MKKKILYILIVIAVLLLGGCIIEKKEEKEIVVDGIEQKIVFLIKRNQYSDSYEDNGYFIDNLGNRYYYNLSNQKEFYYKDMNYEYEYLVEHMEEYEKEPYLEKEQLYEAYKHLLKVDKNAEKKEENISVDYGYVRFWGIRPSEDGGKEFILLEEKGDFEITVLDKNVDEVMEIIGRDNWVTDIRLKRQQRDIWQKSKKETN